MQKNILTSLLLFIHPRISERRLSRQNPNPMMEVSPWASDKCLPPPIRHSLAHPLPPFSRFSLSFCKNLTHPISSVRPCRRRPCHCSASNPDTLLAGAPNAKHHPEVIVGKKDEFGDLKTWMHKNGLPPCKVVLNERPSHDENHKPIHYVAASEDLQVRWREFWFFLFRYWLIQSFL